MSRKERNDDSGGQGPFGRPFDIKEPAEDIILTPDSSSDGIINHWEPIPRLKELLWKLFPPRISEEES